MNEPQQSHEWQFWAGVIALLVAIPFAVASDVLEARLAFAGVALVGFIMAVRAVALDAGKTFDNRSTTEKILTEPGFASPQQVADALARRRRQVVAGIRWAWKRTVAEFVLFGLLAWWYPATRFFVVMIVLMSFWELMSLRRELRRLVQLENATAAAKRIMGTST